MFLKNVIDEYFFFVTITKKMKEKLYTKYKDP